MNPISINQPTLSPFQPRPRLALDGDYTAVYLFIHPLNLPILSYLLFSSLHPSPDGTRLASGGGDKAVRFWNTITHMPQHTCLGKL